MQIKDKTLTNIVKGIENVIGENISIIDFTDLENTICKYFVICDCQSNTQVNAISSSIKRVVSKNIQEKPFNIDLFSMFAFKLFILSINRHFPLS